MLVSDCSRWFILFFEMCLIWLLSLLLVMLLVMCMVLVSECEIECISWKLIFLFSSNLKVMDVMVVLVECDVCCLLVV